VAGITVVFDVGGHMVVHADQLHSGEARRDPAIKSDSATLENLESAGRCGGISRHRSA